ncbi:2-C-methyl-D-erythritol 4-phosphate cytidylyltransferase [Brachybacterium endophyticum]|uniref:2-C-methyl-D-erythritol 4-phosphate cytidylyltransferase n=1 Tax=Brachybacterium endophyticum TaxID=2182385 RepID=A0A2U2RMB4_9MICO|nr:IspD/TarI family cytidylyltransferase [Brachybacterium endophyticum]PWH07008.1 2-C-methyl-D-erythritol 4-phosphate cytidylyltransferase [Brachybacterium endophyticum]
MSVGVIFAGGIGSRMNSRALPKQFLEVNGRPIIVHTLQHFEDHPEIEAVAVAILPAWRDHFSKLVSRYELTKVKWIVDGGGTGQQSRHRALQAVSEERPADTVVLVHDGVRPLIDEGLISRNIRGVEEYGTAITCCKVNETIVTSDHGEVGSIIPRGNLFAARAPQSFRLGEILAAYDAAVASGEDDTIDSCSVMKDFGSTPLHRIDGPVSNIKITTAEDFYVSRTYFELIENQQIVGF